LGQKLENSPKFSQKAIPFKNRSMDPFLEIVTIGSYSWLVQGSSLKKLCKKAMHVQDMSKQSAIKCFFRLSKLLTLWLCQALVPHNSNSTLQIDLRKLSRASS